MKKNLLKLLLAATLSLPATDSFAEAVYGLTASNQIFVIADASNPSAISGPYSVSGMTSGQNMVAIDFRPRDGHLYALGYNSTTFEVQLYRIDIVGTTYTAVAINTTPNNMQLGSGTSVAFDFNATSDNMIMVAGSDGSNTYMLDAMTGAVLNTGANVSYATGDINYATTAELGAMAYMNSFYGSDATAMIGFDLANNTVVMIDDNDNTSLHTIGLSGLLVNSDGVGMDIWYDSSTHTNSIYLSATTLLSTGAHLYSIDENTGLALDMGAIGSGSMNVKDIAVELDNNSGGSVMGNVMIGLTLNQHNLVFFDSDDPGHVMNVMSIDGMTSGQAMVAIDFNPENGWLYGLGYNSSNNQYQLYTLDITSNTDVATAMAINSTPGTLMLTGMTSNSTNVAFDFNPVTNDIRVMSGNGLNVMLDAGNGMITADSSLYYGSGDLNVGANVSIGAMAHTNSYYGATSTDMIGLDFATSSLVNFDNNTNNDGGFLTGSLNTMLSLSSLVGTGNNANGYLDIWYDAGTSTNIGFLAVNSLGYDDGVSNHSDVFQVDPATGNTTPAGTIGKGIPVTDIATSQTAPTGVRNVAGNAPYASLLLYPNPVASQARIVLPYAALSTVYVDVIDLRGQVMRSFSYAPGSTTLDVDLSTLATGIYNVRVLENRNIHNIKVVKE